MSITQFSLSWIPLPAVSQRHVIVSLLCGMEAHFDPSEGHAGPPLVPLRVWRSSELTPANAVACAEWIPTSVPQHLNVSLRELTLNCGIEVDEWVAVEALVTPNQTVLELGARYGTTSCWLSHATNNSGRVVSVEPDVRAHGLLQHNRRQHRCNFGIVRGTIAMEKPLALHHSPYG